jgi:exodeoxyribonuclease VII large subunit
LREVGGRKVWALSEVAGAVFRRLEDVPSVWLQAEITNLAVRGQRVYFTLVDDAGERRHQMDSSMKAVVFDRLAAKPKDGDLVHVYGRVEYWTQRSQVRFTAERIELTGDGLLLARIEELKQRLIAEGLTAEARKRPPPYLPRRIGVVTSGEGAARVDFITNVTRRFPPAQLLVVHSLVQGESAPGELVRAITYLDGVEDVDVIVVTRGGGSLEDLMAFNSERVCRAVALATTPVISAVGHETDTTLCDLVADLRVSTPTKAAEAVVPDAAELMAHFLRAEVALARALRETTTRRTRRVDDLATRLGSGLRNRGSLAGAHVDGLSGRLVAAIRGKQLRAPAEIARRALALERATSGRLADTRARVDHLAALHELLSPARTVSRGYAIVRTVDDDRVLTDAAAATVGDALLIELRDGRINVEVRG